MKLKGRVGKRKGVGERGRGGNYVNIALINKIHKKILKVDFFFYFCYVVHIGLIFMTILLPLASECQSVTRAISLKIKFLL